MRGKFFVLEGPDGSGTTLHASLLAKKLTKIGKDVLLTMEPSESDLGRFIRKELKETPPMPPDALQLLFCADRAKHIAHVILPALKKGMIVVSDRYVPSTIAYGSALGLDEKWLINLNKKFIQPDCTVFLLPPLSISLQRIGKRTETDLLEKGSLQKKVHAIYRRISPSYAHGVIDSSGTQEQTADRIWNIIASSL